ncbi:MAG: hypothetical protein HZA14_10610 [Nitrospirae bacterium]|nr:hypothetical protein [Nitrospirota bacterium]
MRKFKFILLAVFTLIFTQACTDSQSNRQEPVFKQLPEIREIKPEKSVKIKVRRSEKDDYSWEISGDDTDEIVKTDKKLRKGLKTE